MITDRFVVPGHLEKQLGPITKSWKFVGSDEHGDLQVVRFEDQPVERSVTFTTLGLSDRILRADDGRELREELVFSCWLRFEHLDIPSVLNHVVDHYCNDHRALLKGQVLGPGGPLFAGSQLEAIYCYSPVYFPDSFARVEGVEPPVQFVWLVPITDSEAHFVRDRGWDAFEDLLVSRDPDVLNLERAGFLG